MRTDFYERMKAARLRAQEIDPQTVQLVEDLTILIGDLNHRLRLVEQRTLPQDPDPEIGLP